MCKRLPTAPGVHLGGYQQMVRSEVMRGRFRDSFSEPKPFVANEVTAVHFVVQDLMHTFEKGHRLIVQVQGTWFPLVYRTPKPTCPTSSRPRRRIFRPRHTASIIVLSTVRSCL